MTATEWKKTNAKKNFDEKITGVVEHVVTCSNLYNNLITAILAGNGLSWQQNITQDRRSFIIPTIIMIF